MCDKELPTPTYDETPRPATMAELTAALGEAHERISLLEADLKEWTDTFGIYGCEPQGCLSALLSQVQNACEQLVHPDPTLIPNADSFAAVWNLLRNCGLEKFPCNSTTTRERALEYIRYLYEQATKTPKPEPPKSERDRLLQDVRYYEFKRGVAFAQLDSIKTICEHIQESLP